LTGVVPLDEDFSFGGVVCLSPKELVELREPVKESSLI